MNGCGCREEEMLFGFLPDSVQEGWSCRSKPPPLLSTHYMDDLCPNLRPCHNKTHACCFALHSVARAESESVKSAYPQVHVKAIETFEAQCRSVCNVRKCVFSCQCQRLKADD